MICNKCGKAYDDLYERCPYCMAGKNFIKRGDRPQRTPRTDDTSPWRTLQIRFKKLNSGLQFLVIFVVGTMLFIMVMCVIMLLERYV